MSLKCLISIQSKWDLPSLHPPYSLAPSPGIFSWCSCLRLQFHKAIFLVSNPLTVIQLTRTVKALGPLPLPLPQIWFFSRVSWMLTRILTALTFSQYKSIPHNAISYSPIKQKSQSITLLLTILCAFSPLLEEIQIILYFKYKIFSQVCKALCSPDCSALRELLFPASHQRICFSPANRPLLRPCAGQ